MTARHAGLASPRPAYAYTGRHEAPPGRACTAIAAVGSVGGETGGLLVCDRPEHPTPWHFDKQDGIMWVPAPVPVPGDTLQQAADPAGAVA